MLGSLGADVGKGRLVEPPRFNDPVLAELVDDEVHELEGWREPRLVEELGESILGGSAVEPNEAADEQTEASGFTTGPLDVGGGPDAAVEQKSLELSGSLTVMGQLRWISRWRPRRRVHAGTSEPWRNRSKSSAVTSSRNCTSIPSPS